MCGHWTTGVAIEVSCGYWSNKNEKQSLVVQDSPGLVRNLNSDMKA